MTTGRGTTSGRREVLVVLLVGVVVLVTALAGPLVPRWHDAPAWLDLQVPPPSLPPQPSASAVQDLGDGGATHPVPIWLSQTIRWLAILGLVVLVFFLLRYVYRALLARYRAIDVGGTGEDQGGLETFDRLDDVTQAALQEGVEHASRALREDLPPGDAVIAAWLALERAAQASGLERDPAQTATEFTLALLDRTPADPAAARTLLRLYHRARFSDHEVVRSDVVAARAALDALAAALPQVVRTTSPAAPGPGAAPSPGPGSRPSAGPGSGPAAGPGSGPGIEPEVAP